MTKTIAAKSLAVIIALMLVFVVFPTGQQVYADDPEITITGDGVTDFAGIEVKPSNGGTFKSVIPVDYTNLELRIEKATDLTEDDLNRLQDRAIETKRNVLESNYYRVAFYADGNKITDTLKDGIDLVFKFTDSEPWYLATAIYDEYVSCSWAPNQSNIYLSNETNLADFRLGVFRIDIQRSLYGVKVNNVVTRAYTGKEVTQPKITLTLKGKTLTKNTDFGINYYNNVKVGKAEVWIDGWGKYSGSITRAFKIIPAKAKIKSTKAKKRALKITIEKKAAKYGAKKFQIRYKIKGTKKWKKKFVTSRTPTIKKLKKGKRYVVQVRAYKSKSYAGKWSLKKTSKKIK